MKSKIIIVCSVVVSIISIVLFSLFYNETSDNNIISNISKNKEVISSNMITMMYETEAGTGIYEETKDTTWPESGYIFNDTLSGCENGGELEYNSQNNTVNLLSNSSDRCYVYFDKYDGVWIDNVSIANVTGSSVTLDVNAISENGNITTYYYSLNDSEEYIETTTNPIIIDDLNKLTEYNIKIYAIDNTGAKSNIYELNASTTDENGPVINSVEVSDVTTDSFTLLVNTTTDSEIRRYYYIIESDNISGTSTVNSYTFYDLNYASSYSVSVFVEDINGNYSQKYSIEVEIKLVSLANYIKNIYSSQENSNIYYHVSALPYGALDNSYRYAGANPNNYICFGSTVENCPTDNLYRIIGVFEDGIKIIKNTSLGNYRWSGASSNQTNIWSQSTLNTSTLNNTFYNGLDDSWKNLILTHSWNVGGHYSYNSTSQEFYNSENSGTSYLAKIGLMYVSDYGYAAPPNYWTTSLGNYNSVSANNWMYTNSYEWTITPSASNTNYAYSIISGNISENPAYGFSYAVRPCFYLNFDVAYISGDGSQENPFRID